MIKKNYYIRTMKEHTPPSKKVEMKKKILILPILH